MSWKRQVSFEAIVGAGAAFCGWGLAEVISAPKGVAGGRFGAALTCAVVGAAVGAGLSLAGGLANLSAKRLAKRVPPGLLVGGFAGIVGGSLGNVFVGTLHWDPGLGWMVMGAGLGAAEGLYERSPTKLRDGAIGGAIGGLAGGALFGLVLAVVSYASGVAARATAFMVLGACLGAGIWLVRAWFAEASLTVLNGRLPGRQLLLAAPVAVIGRAPDVALTIFPGDKSEVDLEHARIIRESPGRFVLEDNHSRYGTSVNHARVLGRVELKNGDVITIASCSIEFRLSGKRTKSAAASPQPPTPPVSALSPAKPAKKAARGVSLCPKCKRPVVGARPYCVQCKLSF